MDNGLNTNNEDENYILPYDFDDLDEPLFKRNMFADDEMEIDMDPADYYDIFPGLLNSEAKYYPHSWR